jgi:hypothetical protein
VTIPTKRELKHESGYAERAEAANCSDHPDEKGIETEHLFQACLLCYDWIAVTIPTKRELKLLWIRVYDLIFIRIAVTIPTKRELAFGRLIFISIKQRLHGN